MKGAQIQFFTNQTVGFIPADLFEVAQICPNTDNGRLPADLM